jgi:hypothetical protein
MPPSNLLCESCVVKLKTTIKLLCNESTRRKESADPNLVKRAAAASLHSSLRSSGSAVLLVLTRHCFARSIGLANAHAKLPQLNGFKSI